jgi:ABC-type transporter lipoprotein component MlaA
MKEGHVEQVGGSHYQRGGKPQHWDLVAEYEWDYFQAQIIKYLMRWKSKGTTRAKRLEDLQKARSFLDKYILLASAYDQREDGGVLPPTGARATPSAAQQEPSGAASGSHPGPGYVNQG